MATITKNVAGNWKAIIRKTGWPVTIKTFRTKRDAEDWARRVEDEMVRGVYIDRAPSERMTLRAAMTRYLAEVSPTKGKGAAAREKNTAKPVLETLGDYSLAAITQQLVADYRDQRGAVKSSRTGKPLSSNTLRLELALLSHLFTVAIQEWGIGLAQNPVAMVRKPKPPKGRNRRDLRRQQAWLLTECAHHSNPMLYWIVVLAIETGMRRGEIVTLRSWSDRSAKTNHPFVRDKKWECAQCTFNQEGGTDVRGGTSPSHSSHRYRLGILGRCPGCATGERKPYDFTEAWERQESVRKLPDLHFHDLRHEAVSRLVEAGLSDQEVAANQGHKSMQMLKRYTHLRAEDLVAKLDRAFQ